jgi:tetratricopeptide (TPR) repeat protein
VSDAHFGRSQLDGLVEALMQVPGLAEREARDARVEELRQALRRPFDPARSPDTRADLTAIVNAAAACSGGLRTLARMVQHRHPGEASSRLASLAEAAIGPVLLSGADREALRRILAEISVIEIADAVSVLGNVPELGSLQIWRDIPAAIRAMERLPMTGGSTPPLISFVERLAEIETGPEADHLRSWLATVAGGTTAENVPASLQAAAEPVTVVPLAGPPARRVDEPGLIWGGVPIRNRNFTGRVALLDRLADALQTGAPTSVLPQTLQGLGGVGKTQLVIEYVYRHLDQYDLVWWIPAEQTATVLISLEQLAERLGLPYEQGQRQQTARTVLDWLAGTDLAWLLVYDNAAEPSTLEGLIPTTGGHVIVTTRIQSWSTVGVSIEVDVFKRGESVELLRNRSKDEQGKPRITVDEADQLADKLGDLPLALEQAAAWYLATAMPISEYIDLLDSHTKELLNEGTPASYPRSVAAFVSLALETLQASAEGTALFFALFAFLGGEPVPLSLLRSGAKADVNDALRRVLEASIPLNRTVRTLTTYGLAKVDPLQRVQVHRLVQLVLRDTLSPEQHAQAQRNVQIILAAASPGDPDEFGGFARQREIGPHIEPAGMILATDLGARQVVLDHARYLYISGDYENSRYLATLAAEAWQQEDWDVRLGENGEFTLLAWAQVANASRTLGDSSAAARIIDRIYPRFRTSPMLGPKHEFTLITGNQVGADLRIAGRYGEALAFDRENVNGHLEVFGPGKSYTLRAQGNLAVDYRLIGQFTEALALDEAIARAWQEDTPGTDSRAILAHTNAARDYYGLGAYRKAIERLDAVRPIQHGLLGTGHRDVLLADRTYAIALRKAGQLAEAATFMRETYRRTVARFGPEHEFSVAATMSYANTLRETGELSEALALLSEALETYEPLFGGSHPLLLAAQVNAAIVHRGLGRLDDAVAWDEPCFRAFAELLGPDHPYTLSAGTSLATDRAGEGRVEEALELSRQMLERSRSVYAGGQAARDGADHPYQLARAINLSHDLRAVGADDEAELLFQESVAGLRRSLGVNHPEVVAAEQGGRWEGDIEPPPT